MREFLSEKEAAAYLSVSRKTLQMWRYKKNGPPYYKLERMVRYKTSELDEWIRSSLVAPEQVQEMDRLHCRQIVKDGKLIQ